MFIDDFKSRYTTIPFAIYHGDYMDNKREKDIEGIYHQHKETEVISVLHGEADIFINQENYRVCAGDTIIISPYTLHRVVINKNIKASYYCICFDLKLIYDTKLQKELENGTLVLNTIIKSKSITGYIKNAYSACKKQYVGWELEATGNLNILFAEIKKNGYLSSSKKTQTGNNFCMQVIEYVSANYAEDITSKNIAEHLFMNNSYFCRLFKKNFGCCFGDYLISYRIEKAKHFLKTLSIPICDVASQSGFNSFSYFSKVFREMCTLTPSAYRKEFKL